MSASWIRAMLGIVAITLIVGCRSGDDADESATAGAGAGALTQNAQAVDEQSVTEDAASEDVDLTDVLGPVDEDQAVTDAAEAERMARAEYANRLQAAIREDDLSQAIEVLSEARSEYPQDSAFTLSLLSVRLQHDEELATRDRAAAASSFLQTAELAREVFGNQAEIPDRLRHLWIGSLLGEARARAQQADADAAVAALDQAFRAGFEQYTLLGEDPFFESLQDEPAFGEFVGDHVQRIRKRLGQKARQVIAENEPFEFDFELPDLDAQPVRLADFQGKIVMVDIWGTWCPPCRREIPHLIKLRTTYAGDLEIVGLNYEQGTPDEVRQQIRDFVAQHGISYVCLVGDEDTQRQIPNFQAFPTTLLIDREGKVRAKLVGYHPYEELDAYVSELIAEGRSAS